jgi:hypothetical protein
MNPMNTNHKAKKATTPAPPKISLKDLKMTKTQADKVKGGTVTYGPEDVT